MRFAFQANLINDALRSAQIIFRGVSPQNAHYINELQRGDALINLIEAHWGVTPSDLHNFKLLRHRSLRFFLNREAYDEQHQVSRPYRSR